MNDGINEIEFISISAAERYTMIDAGKISRLCNNKIKQRLIK